MKNITEIQIIVAPASLKIHRWKWMKWRKKGFDKQSPATLCSCESSEICDNRTREASNWNWIYSQQRSKWFLDLFHIRLPFYQLRSLPSHSTLALYFWIRGLKQLQMSYKKSGQCYQKKRSHLLLINLNPWTICPADVRSTLISSCYSWLSDTGYNMD